MVKQPLLFLSLQLSSTRHLAIDYTLSNLCCFYRSIILNAPFDHCLYEATFVVFIVQLSSTRRLAIDYIKQPLLFLSSIILNAQKLLFLSFIVGHCLY